MSVEALRSEFLSALLACKKLGFPRFALASMFPQFLVFAAPSIPHQWIYTLVDDMGCGTSENVDRALEAVVL